MLKYETPSIGLPPPGSCELSSCMIAGVQLKVHVREIKIYESIMRPYILVEFTMYDHHNWGNTLLLEGGEPVSFVVTNAFGTRYQWSGVVAKQKGEIAAASNRTVGTLISATDQSYVENPGAKVTGSWRNILGTDVISQIHQQYLKSSPIYKISPSLGMIGEKEPFIISNERPWDAIAKIRRQITSTAFPDSGAYAYFRDQTGFVLAPLEQLFSEAQRSSLLTFVQDGTVGKSFLDMHKLQTQILAFKSATSYGGGNINKGAKNYTSSPIVNQWDVLGTSFKKLVTGLSQSHYIPHDRRLNKIAPKQIKAKGENKIGDLTQDGPGYSMQVLFDLGCKLTVGKGVIAKPVIPQGDLTGISSGVRRAGGLGLIVNLVHHIKNYDSKPQAVTTVECSQGGIERQ